MGSMIGLSCASTICGAVLLATLNRIKAAIDAAAQKGLQTRFNGKMPEVTTMEIAISDFSQPIEEE